jgi:ATPase family associated with various cellular activities (AAA)
VFADPSNHPVRRLTQGERQTTAGVAVTENGWFEEVSRTAERFLDNIETVVHGKREEIKLVLAALICGGHVLLEDVPGTAKTVLARAIAATIEGATPSRIQCTPDLQPTDVTGLSVFNQKERDFEFRAGPIFANVVLVDEINRAMPKTQAALLEATFAGSVPDPNYRSALGGLTSLRRMAAIMNGLAFDERNFQAVANAVSTRLAAKGITRTAKAEDRQQVPLAKWFVLGALAPLALLLWRRNEPLELLRRRRAVA